MGVALVRTTRSRIRSHARGVGRPRPATAIKGNRHRNHAGDRPLTPPPIVTVFRRWEGGIYHARCRHQIQFHGTRGGLEADFYCLSCCEHVTLPQDLLWRIPVDPL